MPIDKSFLGGIIGSGLGIANQWASNIYNSPKNQIKRLKKLGFSKNAYLQLGNPGSASASYVNPILEGSQTLQNVAGARDTQISTKERKRLYNWGEKKAVLNISTGTGMEVIKLNRTNFEFLQDAGVTIKEAEETIMQGDRLWSRLINEGEPLKLRLKAVQDNAKMIGLQYDNAAAEKAALKVLIDSAGKDINFFEALLLLFAQQGIAKAKN